MPIKKENKKLYPENWKEISEYIRFKRAKNKCEFCGIENYSYLYRYKNYFVSVKEVESYINSGNYSLASDITENSKLIKIILTTAHLDHNPQNNDFSNLRALCQKCHNNYDRKHRNETIFNNKKKFAAPSIQLSLF